MSFLAQPEERSTFEAARELKHLMISRATDTPRSTGARTLTRGTPSCQTGPWQSLSPSV